MTTDSPFDFSTIILKEHEDFVIVNKPPGLATQSKDQTDLMQLAEKYFGQQIFPCHRIDQPSSGIVILGKSARFTALFSKELASRSVARKYLAIVGQSPDPASGELKHFLSRSRNGNRMIAGQTGKGKPVVLNYVQVQSSDKYHLLEITLVTGRQHQIRAQLGAIGSPIKGDNKYGFKRGNRDRSIHLHSWKISFTIEGSPYHIEAGPPDEPLWNVFSDSL